MKDSYERNLSIFLKVSLLSSNFTNKDLLTLCKCIYIIYIHKPTHADTYTYKHTNADSKSYLLYACNRKKKRKTEKKERREPKYQSAGNLILSSGSEYILCEGEMNSIYYSK